MEKQNLMKQIRVSKITLNIGVGEPGDKLDKAIKILEKITGAKPVRTTTSKRIPTFGIRPGLQIACKVTLRKENAEKVLSNLLKAKDKVIEESKFDNNGNFSFGIKEYIDIPDVEYEPEIGIIGLEVAVSLERPGFRLRRRARKSKIGTSHLITKEESMKFMQENFSIRHELPESEAMYI
jgi:large subunit ribosomal protein L5